ncbi:hypothetical protein IQ273_10570 [Nodosilinea sp. LEGE 07298]|uniref:hypothetical protein n=1 Tax=Nodosilinea sp. LEGE 07298 TaxID=2777970 RepID=UPI00187FCA43|nr:hypothetical protein [Nodosilinea sp. LEGE 07298]MBE9109853.1 hypothetical protein [Nodosilinea sp. LEGE 07298]
MHGADRTIQFLTNVFDATAIGGSAHGLTTPSTPEVSLWLYVSQPAGHTPA